jgi:putative glycerol-1-phosphate prenyltransferase
MTIYNKILKSIKDKRALFFVLIDPDRSERRDYLALGDACQNAGVDAVLVGSSILINNTFSKVIKDLKKVVDIPVIIFPGNTLQISKYADAILFLSLISGRNPNHLFGEHVVAAPAIKSAGLEPISTGYMLIESGKTSSVEFMSNTKPIPADKPEIAKAHALAAEYMGMKLIYLEAGSGADYPVPDILINEIKNYINLPIVVGGGIRTPEIARKKVNSGASIIVVGSIFEKLRKKDLIKEFSQAIHCRKG